MDFMSVQYSILLSPSSRLLEQQYASTAEDVISHAVSPPLPEGPVVVSSVELDCFFVVDAVDL